jgi:hypothetical protein
VKKQDFTILHNLFFVLKVFNTEPDFVRDGGSGPVALIFEKLMPEKNLLFIPIGKLFNFT